MLLRKINYLHPTLLLLFMLLFVPTTYKLIKILLLGLSLYILLLHIIRKKEIYLSRSILNITLVMVVTGLCYVFYGLVNGNLGALRVATVYVAWPLIYLMLITLITNEETLKRIIKVFNFSLVSILLYSLFYILSSRNIIPSFLYIDLDLGQGIGFYDGFTEFTMYSLASLMFLVPLYVSHSFLNFNKMNRYNKMVTISVMVLVGVISLLSGRRALQLMVLISPFIHYAFFLIAFRNFGSIKRIVKYSVMCSPLVVILFVVSSTLYDINLSSILIMFKDGFNFSNPYDPRKLQLYSLLSDWSMHPFFGVGFGASTDVIRSLEMPWAYELSYVALLFNVGIVGFLIYLGGVGWIYYNLIKIAQYRTTSRKLIIPLLVGMTSFLIANATNPYLAKFDYLWVIFVPIGFINFYRLNKRDDN